VQRRRSTPFIGAALLAILGALAVFSPATAAAGGGYGRLIATAKIEAAGIPKASFHGVRPAPVFWLVVSNPTTAKHDISWSVSCANPAHKASGGSKGEATIVRGRWVKRIRANWITHPSYCSGRVEGVAGSAPLQLRVYADQHG
jgi:hypothetical protein